MNYAEAFDPANEGWRMLIHEPFVGIMFLCLVIWAISWIAEKVMDLLK